jgi:hypothetical protein
MTGQNTIQIPTDNPLAEELGGEDVVEMANLRPPRPASQPNFSVTVADTPTVVANRLPVRVVRQLSPQIIDWVSRNKDALLDFWYHGDTWTQPEVNDFIQKLQRV